MAVLLDKEVQILKEKYDYKMRHMTFNITNRCNMNCSCCIKNSNASNTDKDLTIEEIDTAFSFIDGSWCVNITGGEPTLRMDLVEYIVKKAKKLGCITRLATNGYCPNEIKKIIKLKIDYISLGLNRFHTIHDDVQKFINIIQKPRVKTKLFINALEDDPVLYDYDPHMVVIKEILMKVGREKSGSEFRRDKSICSCRGLTVFPSGIIAPFCLNAINTCVYWKLEDFSKSLIDKYFNEENRRTYIHEKADMEISYCEHDFIKSEENDAKEKTKRSKGLPIV